MRGIYFPLLRQRLTRAPSRGGVTNRRPTLPTGESQAPIGNYEILYALPGSRAPSMMPTPPPLDGHMQATFQVPTMTFNPNQIDAALMLGKDKIGGMGIDLMNQMQQLSWMRQDNRRPGVVSPEAVLV